VSVASSSLLATRHWRSFHGSAPVSGCRARVLPVSSERGQRRFDSSSAVWATPNAGPSGSSATPASSGPASTAPNPSRSMSPITAMTAAGSSPAAAIATPPGAPRGRFELVVPELIETLDHSRRPKPLLHDDARPGRRCREFLIDAIDRLPIVHRVNQDLPANRSRGSSRKRCAGTARTMTSA
jgi:hypothetical protein